MKHFKKTQPQRGQSAVLKIGEEHKNNKTVTMSKWNPKKPDQRVSPWAKSGFKDEFNKKN